MVTLCLLQMLKPLAGRIGLVDDPGGRKHHHRPVPLIGGIAIYAALLVVSLVTAWPLAHESQVFLLASAVLVLVGVYDDAHELTARTRLLAQALTACLMIGLGGQVVTDLGHLTDSGSKTTLDWLAVPFTVFAAVGGINAMNLSDGLDGLASGLALIGLGMLALAASGVAGLQTDLLSLMILLGAITAFFLMNFRFPWRVHGAELFMGDAGSTFIGFAFAWFFVRLSQSDTPAITPVVALWIFAIPLMDTVSVMVRRILRGRSPFAPDREHLHHILLVAGYGVRETCLIILALALALAAVGYGAYLYAVPESLMFYGFLAMFGGYFMMTLHAWKVMKWLKQWAGKSDLQSLPVKRLKSQG